MSDNKFPPQGATRICPLCAQTNMRSTVSIGGKSTRTKNPTTPSYWDESGSRVAPMMTNTVTSVFSCSGGHTWAEDRPCY